MNRPQSLKQRLVLTTVVIVTVVSTLFAGGVMLLKQQLEEVTFGRMVTEHMAVLKDNPRAADELTHPVFSDWLLVRGSQAAELPERVRALPAGAYHSVRIGDNFYQIQVAGDGSAKEFLLYDISEWEAQEHELLLTLAYGIFIVLLLAVFMASRAARRILAPVRKLTARLALIHPDQRSVRIAGDFDDPDIGQIAGAFDAYAARIDQFVERERSFTAAASHELRTPLSVMIGAVDVIEASEPPATSRRALERMRRACGEMQAFIEATLFLSREQQSGIQQSGATDLRQVIQQVVEDNRERIAAKHIDLTTECLHDRVLDAPDSIVKITLANLLRNAIEHTEGGTICIRLSPNSLVIEDSGEGIASDHLSQVFDRSFSTKATGAGLGLNMVKRICDRFGWQVSIDSEIGRGTTATIIFPSLQVADPG